MAIDADSGKVITLTVANKLTLDFRDGSPLETKAYFVGANKLNNILNQDDCIGIRIYNGFDIIKQKRNLVLVGVDKNCKDMINGIIVDRLVPCPVDCDATSSLNS